MNKNTLTRFVAIPILLALLVSPVFAQEFEPTEAQKEQIAKQLEHTRQQLELTDEQYAAVEPIMTGSFMDRMAIMNKYGINPGDPDFKRPGMGTMRKMRKEMDKLSKETNKQLEVHLTEEQMAALDKMEKERRDRMRKELSNR